MNYEFYSEMLELSPLHPLEQAFAPARAVQVLHARDLRNGLDRGRPAVSNWQQMFHSRSSVSAYNTRLAEGMKLLEALGLNSSPVDLRRLPPGSSALDVEFTLRRPAFTRADETFYPCANSIRKDQLSGAPIIEGSSWKGSIRAAAVDLLLRKAADAEAKLRLRRKLIDIFGDEKGADVELQEGRIGSLAHFLDARLGKLAASPKSRKGRLHLMPSYFGRVELDVLNPRDRATRTGTDPIMMEVIPAGTTGLLRMIHVPFDLLGRDEAAIRAALATDWALIGAAVVHMLGNTAFGAKKSNGFGRAQPDIDMAFETSLSGVGSRQGRCRLGALRQLGTLFIGGPNEA